jgi:hypothetical protein
MFGSAYRTFVVFLIVAFAVCVDPGQSRASGAVDCQDPKNRELKAEACTRFLKRGPCPGDVAALPVRLSWR